MANEIKLRIRIEDDGSLTIVTKKAKQAAQAVSQVGTATQKAGKFQDKYLRGQKGVAGATANSTKAFSKMQQGLSGSTGLVQSYAILASNIFAATAAFNALRRVAQVEQLGKGLQFVGNVVGRDLEGAARRLTEITGSAVSMAQAMRTTAVGISAGFKGEEIEGLAKIAKGASIALGRDMADAMDRLVRGTAKLEPEILDELGILVRLDTAARKYATQMNTTVDSLSQFERQQAFLNETLEQGLKKYEDIADAIDPNPYDKLSAALTNLAVSAVTKVEGIFRLSEGISYLAENITALAGVVGVATIPITKRLLPGMFNMAKGAAEAAENTAEHSRELLRNIPITEKMTDRMKQALTAIRSGEGTAEDFAIANDSLNKSLNTTNAYLKKNENTVKATSDTYIQATERSKQYTAIKSQLLKVQKEEAAAVAQARRATALQLAGTGQLKTAFKEIAAAKVSYAESLALASEKTTRFTKAIDGAKVAMFGLSTGVKAVGAAFLRFLPYIGLIITAGTILYSFVKDKFFPENLVDKRLKEAAKSFSNFSNIVSQFEDSTAEGGVRLVNAYIAWAGILDEIQGKLKGISSAVMQIYAEESLNLSRRKREIEIEIAGLAKYIEEQAANAGDLAGKSFIEKFMYHLKGRFMGEIGAQQQIDKLEEERGTILERQAELELEALKERVKGEQQVLSLSVQQLEVAQKLSTDQGMLALVGEEEINKVREFAAIVSTIDITNMTEAQLLAVLEMIDFGFQKIKRDADIVRDVFKSVTEATLKFNQELGKVQQKARGPFDNIIAAADTIVQKYVDIQQKTGISDAKKSELTSELNESIRQLNLKSSFGEGQVAVERFYKELYEANQAIILINARLKEQQKRYQVIKDVTAGIYGAEGLRLEEERTTLVLERAEKEAQVAALRKTLSEEGIKNSRELAKLEGEIEGLTNKILTNSEIQLKSELAMLKVVEEDTKLKRQQEQLQLSRIKNAQIEANIAKGLGARTTIAQDYEAAIDAAELQVATAKDDYTLTQMRGELEYKILEARLKFFVLERGMEESLKNEILGSLKQQLDIQERMAATRVSAAEEELRLTKLTLGEARGVYEMFGHNFGQQLVEGIEGAITSATAKIDEFEKARERSQGIVAHAEAQIQAGGLTQDEIKELNVLIKEHSQIVIQANAAIGQSFIETTAIAITPFIEELKKLGPEGEVTAALAEGMLVIASAFETLATKGVDLQDKLAAVGSIVSAISAIQQASSNAAVAAIDKEIEAEKRRDGKSAQSVAKINALEKKKEAQKRKAFEQNKKMLMAQTVMNTAAAVMATLARDGFWAIPLAAVIAAMGAAQLAIIAGSTYDGGGAGGASEGPASVTIGERKNTVDLARSRSPAGEIAYMRGEQGTGATGATNYVPVPSFTGRATGGNTAYMVGEQGPELFIPSRPGTVVPADETEKLGGPVNVNFSINAIDSQGMEEALFRQRGNIIGMIREAANSRGTLFLEEVNIREDDAL